jgi:hypothetical protein
VVVGRDGLGRCEHAERSVGGAVARLDRLARCLSRVERAGKTHAEVEGWRTRWRGERRAYGRTRRWW